MINPKEKLFQIKRVLIDEQFKEVAPILTNLKKPMSYWLSTKLWDIDGLELTSK